LLLNAAVFLGILVSIQTDRNIDPTNYFFFAMTMLSLSAISTSIVQNGMFGLASKFTGRHVQGVMLGQGLAGAGVAISQIVTQILSPPKGTTYADETEGLEHSAFLFFLFALGYTLFAVLAQALLIRLPIYEFYTEEQPQTNRRLAEEEAEQRQTERVNHYRSTMLYISITLIFALTLSLFPSLTALVESTNTAPDRARVFGDLFVPLHFLIYNLGDWTGRSLPSFALFSPNTTHPTRRQQLRYLLSAFGRCIFIPIFLTANLPIPEDTRLLPLLIRRDEIWFLLVFLFALSNGYLGSLIMMVGPACVLGGENKARAGVKLGFWLTTGLAMGSVASFGVRELMCVRGGCSSL
ncbi:equilibrative nucleoside transporter, partial [Linnemannia elongata]